VRVFKNGSYLDSELLSAYVALIKTDAVTLAVEFADTLGRAAMRANRAFGPKAGFNVRVRSLFIMKVWLRNN